MNVQQLKQSLIEHPRQEASIKFPFVAGAMRRRKIRGFFDSAHLMFNLTVDYTESKGWLDSDFYVRVSGRSEDILEFVKEMEEMSTLNKIIWEQRNESCN